MRKLLMLLLAVVCLIGHAAAQNRTVTGTVTDPSGSPVSNTSILIKGTSIGTTSKSDGTYSLTIPATARVLQFSAVGYGLMEITIGNKGVINASLQPADKNLQEVVVVGYGTQKRKDVTASIATVKGAVIAEKPVQSFESALAGRASGVQITVPNGVV